MAVAAVAGDWVPGGDILTWFLLPAHPAVTLTFVIGYAGMALDAMIGRVGDSVGKTSATVGGRRSKGSKAQANRTPTTAAEHTRSWISQRAWYLVTWVVLALLTIGAMPQFRPFLLPQVIDNGPGVGGGRPALSRRREAVAVRSLGDVYTRSGTGYQGDSVYYVFYLLEFARAVVRNGAPKDALLMRPSSTFSADSSFLSSSRSHFAFCPDRWFYHALALASRTRAPSGLGTGIATVKLSRANISVVAVELDTAVARYVQEYFGVGVGGPASVTVIVGDGGAALEESAAGRYDLVVHDVFSNGGLPARLFSEAAMHAALRCLREGEVLALVRDLSNRFVSGFIKSNTALTVRRLFILQNIVGSIRSPLLAHVLETLKKVFYASASAAPLSFDLARLTALSNVGSGGAVRATALQTFSEALAKPQRPALGPSAATSGDKDASAQARTCKWVGSRLRGQAPATVGVGTAADADAHWSVMEDEFGSGFWAPF
ncbi:hypothetical protein HK405_010689 [Cladochytrium tenue]|nr:hypothetical protein HK405_010689 [Cladochytrium tenue]